MTKAKDNLNYNKKALNLDLAIMKRAIIKASKTTFDKYFTKQKSIDIAKSAKISYSKSAQGHRCNALPHKKALAHSKTTTNSNALAQSKAQITKIHKAKIALITQKTT